MPFIEPKNPLKTIGRKRGKTNKRPVDNFLREVAW
jgi:hypothetical protein